MPTVNKNILKIFGANLKRIRMEKGFSQRELSARCNIDNSDISRMENGQINVTLETVAQLAEALSIPFFELVEAK